MDDGDVHSVYIDLVRERTSMCLCGSVCVMPAVRCSVDMISSRPNPGGPTRGPGGGDTHERGKRHRRVRLGEILD